MQIISKQHESEILEISPSQTVHQRLSSSSSFIEANTIESSLEEIKEHHIIPVFIKDNEPLISQTDFIEATQRIAAEVFDGEVILKPSVRLSHPIKGRVPSAKDKPAVELMECEKTLYYERMAFIIEIPSISADIDGSHLSLTIGGVKALNLDNLYGKKGSEEHFKIFIGFQNKVCTNLCVWSDGYISDLKVTSLAQLKINIRLLLESYNACYQINMLQQLPEYSLTEKQFATLIGRCRMYPHLPRNLQQSISPLLFGDNQLSTVVKDYYRDQSFSRNADGTINLWRLYNLFTGANKSTYIDNFLDKSLNAYLFVEQLKYALNNQEKSWFLY